METFWQFVINLLPTYFYLFVGLRIILMKMNEEHRLDGVIGAFILGDQQVQATASLSYSILCLFYCF